MNIEKEHSTKGYIIYGYVHGHIMFAAFCEDDDQNAAQETADDLNKDNIYGCNTWKIKRVEKW